MLLGINSATVAVTSRGEYIVPASGGFQLAVYDPAGKFVRSFGRRGRGPGELQLVSDLRIGEKDSLIVADARNSVQVFGPGFDYVRSIRVPAAGQFSRALLLPTGEIIKQTSRDLLVVMGPSGTVRESIPVVPVPAAPTCDRCNARWLARASTPGRFWTTVSNRYEIQQLDHAGTVHQAFVRRPTWFVPWDSAAPRGAAPLPTMGAVREDSDGLLWILALVPDPKWKEVEMNAPASIAMFAGLNDAVLTVVDPRRGTVLAERRLPGPVSFLGHTDLMFTQTEDKDGFVSLEILRVQLKR